ncbi:MAG TPA: LytTR family DNA-binding domain-containing protein [Hyphomonadaceae bacterium]|nr:LytTR family DNA-binding domain-containing protein [Hyphomonadaceae bacterium]
MRTATFLRQARYLGLLAAIGLFMALLNPFGSVTDVATPVAVAYWVSLIVYGGIMGQLTAWAVRRLFPGLPLWGYLGALSLLMTVTVFPGVMLAQWLIQAPIQPEDYLRFAFYILLISIAVVTVIVLGFRAFKVRSAMLDPDPTGEIAQVPAPPPTPPSSFLDRLPIKFRTGEIYAVSSEDHYLRVHTSLGEALILLRLADAVRELAAVEGLQTHRSWWVARQGLADVTRGDGRVVLKLKSGAEAPVSRTFQKAVKDAGWV